MGLVNECHGTLFKDSKKRNYFIKKLNISIFNTLITRIFVKKLPLKILESVMYVTY